MDRGELEDGTVVLEPSYLDCAAIGTDAVTGRLVYSFSRLVEAYMTHDNMTYEDAVGHIGYKTIRAIPYMGEKAPIVLCEFDGVEVVT